MADGGINEARVPPAATTPEAKRLSYPSFSISGTAMRANTAEVATDAPETAAKPAVENTVATPMPPGSQPSQRFAASNRARVRPA